ncbi:MAG TPA: winged helix-turn-helix domain-containing protein [Vicinamibacterales bacterium]|nr:winged helix-turn-helix domain-containing protein [Vicinamibacterales bacterium]
MSGSIVYAFGSFELDAAARRLTRAGESVPMSDRHVGVLLELVSRPGAIVSKDAIIDAVWRGVAVTDNSLEQAISAIRRVIGDGSGGTPGIQTVARQGYRFIGTVTKTAARASGDALEALLAPHRAWIEGRAALETLKRDQILHAREVFERVLRDVPDEASAHVGLANALVLLFETTRVDPAPDVAALEGAVRHAREACQLQTGYGEAWATLGFVLDRIGRPMDALAASRRAIALEPDNWRHHFRLSYVGWGEERLRSAHRVLTLLPGFPLAHWLAATVHVARQAFDDADRELASAVAGEAPAAEGHARFSAIALHWLRGLIHLARGDDVHALAEFEKELANETSGHLYARECCANTWYAIGALRLRQGRSQEARAAFEQCIERVALHPGARLGIAAAAPQRVAGVSQPVAESAVAQLRPVDAALWRAAGHVLAGSHGEAAALMESALADAPAGNGGWLLPVEPLLRVHAAPDVWAGALARLRARAA